MVQEKVDAAIEGAFAAQAAWGRSSSRPRSAACARPTTFRRVSPAIAEAAAAPARRKVRANARRLTGAKALALTWSLFRISTHLVATYGYLAVFVIVAMESAGIPMPGETVLVTAAIFAASGTLQYLRGDRRRRRRTRSSATIAAIGSGGSSAFRSSTDMGAISVSTSGGSRSGSISFSSTAGRSSFSAASSPCCAPSRRSSPASIATTGKSSFSSTPRAGSSGPRSLATGGYLLGRAFEHYARPVGIAALIAAVIGVVFAARFIRSHEQALRTKPSGPFRGPLDEPPKRLGATALNATTPPAGRSTGPIHTLSCSDRRRKSTLTVRSILSASSARMRSLTLVTGLPSSAMMRSPDNSPACAAGPGLVDGEEPRAGRLFDAESERDAARDRGRCSADPDIGPPHPPVPGDLAGDEARGVGGDRKADALRAHDHGGVDADHFARRRHQRPARIARVERRVGLHHVLDHPPGARLQRASERRDDARGHRRVEAERIADRDCDLAALEPGAVAEFRRGQRDVGFDPRAAQDRCRDRRRARAPEARGLRAWSD